MFETLLDKNLFVTGIDTGVGKTHVTGLLAQASAAQGRSVVTQKWVQTGSESDICVHDQYLSYDGPATADDRCPYRFELPASPHLSAQRAGASVSFSTIALAYQRLCADHEHVIVEGSGGLLVPVSRDVLMVDWVVELGLSLVLVVSNRLGCLNHTFLTLDYCRSHDIPIVSVVMNHCDASLDPLIAEDNIIQIRAAFHGPVELVDYAVGGGD